MAEPDTFEIMPRAILLAGAILQRENKDADQIIERGNVGAVKKLFAQVVGALNKRNAIEYERILLFMMMQDLDTIFGQAGR